LKGKNVKVKKKDGFVKIGQLVDINQSFLILQYFDGRIEIIPLGEIAAVVEIERGDEDGRKK
jgi:hypothetical protein